MKLLMLSTDRSAFEPGSAFRERLREYDTLFDELHVIVFGVRGYRATTVEPNIYLWPASGVFKWLGWLRGLFLGIGIARRNRENFLVTSQEEFGALAAFGIKLFCRVPWQAQIHSDIFSPYFATFSRKNKIRVFIARLILPQASCIRVVSGRITKSLQALGITKVPITILPIFTDAERFRIAAQDRDYGDWGFDFVMLMVGRLAPEKNIDMALYALSRIVEKYPQTTLRIVGDGPERLRLEELARSLTLGAHVQFEGWKQNTEPFLKAADCFLLTSWYEGYGMSAVEAMVAGLPIVMTDVGIAGSLVVDGVSGIVCPPGDIDRFSEALLAARTNHELREKIGTRAKNAASGLMTKEEYLQVFKESCLLCKNTNKN